MWGFAEARGGQEALVHNVKSSRARSATRWSCSCSLVTAETVIAGLVTRIPRIRELRATVSRRKGSPRRRIYQRNFSGPRNRGDRQR